MRDSLKTKLIAKNREGEYKALGTALEKKKWGKDKSQFNAEWISIQILN